MKKKSKIFSLFLLASFTFNFCVCLGSELPSGFSLQLSPGLSMNGFAIEDRSTQLGNHKFKDFLLSETLGVGGGFVLNFADLLGIDLRAHYAINWDIKVTTIESNLLLKSIGNTYLFFGLNRLNVSGVKGIENSSGTFSEESLIYAYNQVEPSTGYQFGFSGSINNNKKTFLEFLIVKNIVKLPVIFSENNLLTDKIENINFMRTVLEIRFIHYF